MLVAGGATLWAAAARAASSASEWSTEVGDALLTYREGDYVSARALAERVLAHTRDPQSRVDAAAVRAMTWLQSPSRPDRLMGLAELTQLCREHPALTERPECNLAAGMARSALAETAAALELLDTAAVGFAARSEHDRLGVALAALAETWSRHNEWEITPPRFNVAKPRDPVEARQMRRDRMAEIRRRAAALPQGTATLARIDLVIAQNLLEDSKTAAAGLQMLEQLATAAEMTPPIVAATAALAERYEAERQWQDAARLYERLAREGDKLTAEEAGRKLAAITRPQLRLDMPGNVPAGQPVRLELLARNIAAVQVEVRKLDLRAWLTARQGRLNEALLPVAGSMQYSRRIAAPAAEPLDWWTSDAAGSLEFEAPAGTYVVYVQAADESGAEPLKRLLIVSDLAAVAWVGGEQAVIWAGRNPQSAAASAALPSLAGEFWMFGSFVPTQPQFEGGIARMALPAEARLFRDRRWVFLARAGDHLALCQGDVPQERDAAGPQIALTGGPAEPLPGEMLTLAGLVLNEGARGQSAPAAWRLEVRNVLDEVLANLEIAPSAAGMFAVELPVPESWSGEHLRFIVRRGQQVAENLSPRLMTRVANAGREEFVICPDARRHWSAETGTFTACVGGWLPWGAPVSLRQLSSFMRAVRLPDEANGFQPVASPALRIPDPHGQLKITVRQPGLFELPLPLEVFDLPSGPTACGLWATLSAWNGQQTTMLSEFLRGPEPVHVWLQTEPAELVTGRPAELRLGSFDPTGRTGLQAASGVVRRAGEPEVTVEFTAQADGHQSALWQPSQAGEYEIEAHIPRINKAPLTISRRVTVQPAADDAPNTQRARANVRVQAERTCTGGEQSSEVRVRLQGELNEPAVVLIAGDEPLAAAAFDKLDGVVECSLPVPPNARRLEARVVGLAAGGPVTLARDEVSTAPVHELEIDIDPELTLLPGQHLTLPFELRTAGEIATQASVLAQLRPALWSGLSDWNPRPVSEEAHSVPAIGPQADASWGVEEAPSQAATSSHVRPTVPLALLQGGALWATCRAAEERRLEFTLPQVPGVYRLSTVVRDDRGALTEKEVLLDTRAGLRLLPDAPARCSLGDRFVIGLAVQNAAAAPVAAAVTVDPGAGLHIESLRAVDAPEGTSSAAHPAQSLTREVVVPAHGLAWLQARVEAVQTGQWELKMSAAVREPRAEIQNSGVQEAGVQYAVLSDAGPGATDRPLQIKRTLFLLDRDTASVEPGEEVDARDRQSPWQRQLLQPDARLDPGQRILVRECFTLTQHAASVNWGQRVPPNFSFAANPVSGPQALGILETPRADELNFRTRDLPVGACEHEYELVATRPGACSLPLPDVWISGQRIETAAGPEELRLNVIDTPQR